jgi:LuxR family maltose regulon positive regulatory protein
MVEQRRLRDNARNERVREMSNQFLTTKFSLPPPRPRNIVRQRLLDLLRTAHATDHHCKLTLLSAPAGFGKSTLLCDWVHSSSHPYSVHALAWLSLDERENDPARFWLSFIAALRKSQPQFGEHLPAALHTHQTAPIEELLTAMLNEISILTEPCALLLEDYHVITAPAIHQALTFLLDRLPAQLRLVLTTRADPALPLARLRAHGELCELRAADLRFTLEETAAFLTQVMGLALSEREVAQLAEQTEGWIAGLQLAALSLQNQEHAQNFVQAFRGSNEFVADYLLEEVLSRQPSHIQAFLLHTSILKQLSGSLVNAVMGTEDGSALLEHVRQANLFIVPLDSERQWYRYHHLFADLLRVRLQETRPELIPVLYRRAIDWYEHKGLINEAIDHALEGRQFEQAAALIERYGGAMLTCGELATALRWLEGLPAGFILARARLCLLSAWAALLSRNVPMIPYYLAAAKRFLQEQEQATEGLTQEVLGNVAGIEAHIARYQARIADSITLSLQALQHLEALPARAAISRGAISLNLGYAYAAQGAVVEAGRVFERAESYGQASGNPYLALAALCNQARLYELQGKLRLAEERYLQALEIGPRFGGQHFPGEAAAYIGLGELCYEWNRCDEALEMLTKGIALGKLIEEISVLHDGSITLARVHFAQGQVEQAFALLRQAKERVSAAPQYLARIEAWEARYLLLQDQVAPVATWVSQRGLAARQPTGDQHEMEYLVLVRLLLSQHRPQAALPLLAHLLTLAEASKRTKSVIEILLLQALTRWTLGQSQQALVPLTQAIELTEPEGYLRLFVDEGARMASFLRQVTAEQVSGAYMNRVLAAFPAGEPTHDGKVQGLLLGKSLSPREQEVLRLIAAGLSNKAAADRLCVTPGAVKKHLNNIYGKLGVNSRTQALVRARDLSLL